MTYPFVQAFHDYGVRKGPVRAFVVHMAEGGGTVEFLSKRNPSGVSVHYVIRYSGQIVQMLREDHMHTSIRTTAIRTSDDADGLYGASVARAVLGDWATTVKTLGPNHASIAVEIEGFAATGPNANQKTALRVLVDDVRSRFPRIGLLGHRDFASYKACPGRLIPWAAIGGHGPAQEDTVEAPSVFETPYQVRMKLGSWLYWHSDLRDDRRNVQLTNRTPDQLVLDYVFTYKSKEIAALRYEPVTPDDNVSSRAMFARWADFDGAIFPKPVPEPDCTSAVKSAVEAFRAKAMDAVRGVPA